VTIGQQLAALGWAFVLQVMPPESMPWYQVEQQTYQQAITSAKQRGAVAVMVDFEHWLEPTSWVGGYYRDPKLAPGKHPRDVLFDWPHDQASLRVLQRSHRVYGTALESVNAEGMPLGVFRIPLLIKYRKSKIAARDPTWMRLQDTVLRMPASSQVIDKPIVSIVADKKGVIFWPVYIPDPWHEHKRRDVGLRQHLRFMSSMRDYLASRKIPNVPVMHHRTQGARSRVIDAEFSEVTFKWLAENYGTEWGVWAGPNDKLPADYKAAAIKWGAWARRQN